MKKILDNRYFKFLVLYLFFIMVVFVNFAYSKYIIRESGDETARVANFDTDFVIYKNYDPENPEAFKNDVHVHVLATSKLSEPSTMINQETCEFTRVNFINKSETSVLFNNFTINTAMDNARDRTKSVYTKLIIDADESYISEHDDSISKSVQAYLKSVMEEFNKNPADVEDAKEKQQLVKLQSNFASDADFQWNGSTITYDENKLGDIDYLNRLVLAANKIAQYKFETEDSSSPLMVEPNTTRTILIVSWVEHDNVYKADADLDTQTRISHNKPSVILLADGHEDESLKETFTLSVNADQYD